jgi:hypothetical protein
MPADIASSQLHAVLGVLAFLATAALVVLGGVGSAALGLLGHRRGAVVGGGGAAALLLSYAIALVAAGLLGRGDRVLGPGAPKYFCEIDCHLAYNVVGVRTAPAVGAARARGRYWLVTVRTRFDERTIGARRGDGPLHPNPRRVRVVDAAGQAWDRDPAATRALAATALAGTPLDSPLRPGESYETTLAFDLPADVAAPALELTEADGVTRLLVGHENSPLHGRTLLALRF